MSGPPRPGLELRQGLRLALTPGLRQSLRILALPLADLHDLIAAELAENPFLERTRPAATDPALGGGAWDLAAETAVQPVSAAQRLHEQILVDAPAGPARDLALRLAAELTPEGYLPAPPALLADELGVDRPRLDAALAILRRCEPAGIGATGLADCLALQLAALGEGLPQQDLVRAHLQLFARRRWAALARLSGLPIDEIRRIAALLPRLDPRPGAQLDHQVAESVIPDLHVRRGPDGVPRVILAEDTLPGLAIDRVLARRSRAGARSRRDAAFVETHLQRASALLQGLAARRRTLLAVTEALVARQAGFFAGQTQRLAPLTRRELAQEMGLHPSTVTRAVAGKYLSCEQGVFALSAFFSRGLDSLKGRRSVSAQAVQQEIRRMIAAESPPGALSDRQIAARLRQSGVDISRRTVAKYRQCLKIPTSTDRRRHASQA